MATRNIFSMGLPVAWGKSIDRVWIGKLKGSQNLIAYRCKSCGYLESYAK